MGETNKKYIHRSTLGALSFSDGREKLRRGETLLMGRFEPLECNSGENFAQMVEGWASRYDEKIQDNRESGRLDGHPDAELLWLKLYRRRLLTFDEYKRFLGMKFEDVYRDVKPLTRGEYFAGATEDSPRWTRQRPRRPVAPPRDAPQYMEKRTRYIEAIEDFIRLLDDEQNERLVEFAKRCPVPSVRDFFKYQFHQSNFAPTKNSLRAKVGSVLTNTVFRRVVTAKRSTFDLEELMNSGAVALFSMKGLGEDGGKVLGRLLMARIRFTAFAREGEPAHRPETFVLVDECHNYIGRSIEHVLTEGRQYKIYLALASQTLGQGMDASLLKVVMSCTNTKLAGVNDAHSYKGLRDSLGVDMETMESLRVGKFLLRSNRLREQRRALPVYVPPWYVNTRGQTSKESWETFREAQLRAFYTASEARTEERELATKHKKRETKKETAEREAPSKLRFNKF